MENGRKKIVITGASGFVGRSLIQALSNREDVEIHALARPSSNLVPISELTVTYHLADITQPSTLSGLFDDADMVIHAAGMLGQASVPEATYRQINTQGTNNVLAAIADSNATPRVLHVSSAGVLGPFTGQARDPSPDETAPLAPSNPYERSKAAAEMIARDYAAAGMQVIIARPEFVYGPGDLHVLGLFQAIQRGVFFYVGAGYNTCHPTYIFDAVAGLQLALETGRPGQIYHITGPRPVTFRELAETIAAEVGVAPPRLALPRSLVWAGAAGAEGVANLLGRSVPLSRTGVAFFSESRRFASVNAQEIAYAAQVDLQDGVRETVAWYRQMGLLPAPDN